MRTNQELINKHVSHVNLMTPEKHLTYYTCVCIPDFPPCQHTCTVYNMWAGNLCAHVWPSITKDNRDMQKYSLHENNLMQFRKKREKATTATWWPVVVQL